MLAERRGLLDLEQDGRVMVAGVAGEELAPDDDRLSDLVAERIAFVVGHQELDGQHVPLRDRSLNVVLAVDADGLLQVKDEVLLFLVARRDILVVRRTREPMKTEITPERSACDVPVQAVGECNARLRSGDDRGDDKQDSRAVRHDGS